MHTTLEKFFTCPYCGSSISMVLELLSEYQTYVEDCEVCCRPIQLNFHGDNGELLYFEAYSIDE